VPRWRTEKATREGGSEWEPIKILLQRENSTYTPIATWFTRTHKSGSKLGTHKPTRPRDKTRTKLEELEAEANHKRWSNKMSAWAGADSPHSRGRPFVVPWQAVCTALADYPKKPPKPPVVHHKERTVRRQPANHPPCADRLYSTHGPSAKPRPPKIHRQNGSNGRHEWTCDEHKEHLVEILLMDRPHEAREQSARSTDSSPSSTLWRSTLPSFHPISRINQGKATKS
jgi:hypothetical protein